MSCHDSKEAWSYFCPGNLLNDMCVHYQLRTALFLKVCLALGSSALFAQSLTLRGQVLDQVTKQPVEYATVALLSRDSVLLTGTTTDGRGQFQLAGVTDAESVIRVQFLGYQTATLRAPAVQNQQKQTLDLQTIFLLASSQTLREVTVQGERAANSVQIDKQVFAARQYITLD